MTTKRKRRRDNPNATYSIEEFCEHNGISVTHYFTLKKNGKGPKEMKLGRRVLITPEAEAEWRRAREAE